MSVPSISVLMPAYNHERYVARALRSITSQSFSDLEIIVVDDASTDETARVAEDFPDSRVRVDRNAVNRGDGGARNRCLELARAPLIAWMDSDDISVPSRLEHQFRFLQMNPDVDVVGGAAMPTDSDGYPVGRPLFAHRSPPAIRWAHLFGTPLVHGTTMVRTHVYDRFGGYIDNIPIGSDNELLLRCSDQIKMAGLNAILLLYRRHDTNITDASMKASIDYAARLTQQALTRLLGSEIDDRAAGLLRVPWSATKGDFDSGALLEAQTVFERAVERFDRLVPSAGRARREVEYDRSVRRLSLWLAALRAAGTASLIGRGVAGLRLRDALVGPGAIASRRSRGLIQRESLKRRLRHVQKGKASSPS